ncbi:MAG: hypothetical protein WDM81_00495 [Rhizomicrobium sp.]
MPLITLQPLSFRAAFTAAGSRPMQTSPRTLSFGTSPARFQ